MVNFFYSDPHFGHAAVLGYCSRPFADVHEMDARLIERYNASVCPSDTVLWLGDCFFHNVDVSADIMGQLNGRKLLVLGNHDRSAAAMARLGFDVVADQLTLCIAGKKAIASHYPYAGTVSPEDAAPNADVGNRPVRHKDQILLQGHTHSATRYHQGMVHVGVDAWDYRPVALNEVEALLR
jgi:calcineurin-like phosphoesterase family protein